MKSVLLLLANLLVAVTGTAVQRETQADATFDISGAVDEICDLAITALPVFGGGNCQCSVGSLDILDENSAPTINFSCTIELPLGSAIQITVLTRDFNEVTTRFAFVNDFLPTISYRFGFLDVNPFVRKLEEISEKKPATPQCEVTYDDKHCLCSSCETSDGKKGYNTYCGELPDDLPASWRRLNEECVAPEDIEYFDHALDIIGTFRQFKSILP